MREPISMPQLGETVSEGTVIKWLRRPGDAVAVDQPLLEIQTDKVSMEVPSLRAGVLAEIVVAEGETVPVGAPLAWLEVADTGSGGEAVPADDATHATAVAAAPAASPPVAAEASEAQRPSPLIRRLLEEAGLTAADVVATGPAARIRREDVAAAVAARAHHTAATSGSTRTRTPPASAPRTAPGGRTEPLSRVRAVIADRMVTSLRTSAQLTSVVEVDVTGIDEARRLVNARGGVVGLKLSFLPYFVAAAVDALGRHPDLNASVDTEASTVTRYDAVHMGIAVDTEGGLMVPVIRDAGRLSLSGIALAIDDVADRTRKGRVTADEMSGGTFTVTNTGSRGALFDTPILNQPQVAILATGAVVRRPAVVLDASSGSEGIAIRSMVFLALTYDHRLVDGAAAAAFLVDVKATLEKGSVHSGQSQA